MVKVSIIIPCYNSYKYMRKCLESLEKQVFKDFEVIFIDDCSSDDTYKKIKKYLEKDIIKGKIIKNKFNCGPGVARNNGIQIAQGEYIAFMDSDDWYEENFLELMYTKAISKSLDIVMCDYFRVYSQKKKIMQPTKLFNINMTKADFLAKSFDSLCCMLIKKELFEFIKLPQQFNAEDVAVIPVLLARSKKIGYVSKALYNYFYRDGSLSTNIEGRRGVGQDIISAYRYISINVGEEFKEELEYIGIKNILYGVVLCEIQNKADQKQIKLIIDEFNKNHPNWNKNKYLKYLSVSKKIYIYMVRYYNYDILRALTFIRSILFKFKIA